ncbi:hypothetical protein SAMN06265338_102508 [Rhodoblastus acidophilus]|uniref:Uncharacterized protein n=2 Tax=Rhodoblastus acidophilus TaxID=1074 RepID=A0A212R3R3_RHOAC|nr:hypothetical protein CKO16_00190 [Rhodoblastus acidophilus]RAI18160.1 hypothetical protein CH337_14830 [Rhodoblastus acidophilus]SNB66676.1 hypothetical protein SAMN06265338_102508 [Rhodoblastus acidophilus]
MSKNLTNSIDFDYHSIVQRMRQKNQNGGRPQPAAWTPRRRAAVPRPRPMPEPRRGFWTSLKDSAEDGTNHAVMAGLAALGLICWLVSQAQALHAENVEATLASACEQNRLNHAVATTCFDNQRIVHVLQPDGTTTKPGLDWRVNERALRKAEKDAEREERLARAAAAAAIEP